MNDTLSLRHIVKQYHEGESAITVLKHVSLQVPPGELVTIVGMSGAGKSTLLHIMGLIDRPTSGQVLLGQQDLTVLRSAEQAKMRAEVFGFVFQFFHLLSDFTAIENVLMPAMVDSSLLGWRLRRRDARDRAGQLLKTVGLDGRTRHRPSQLSGGERQRVAICRALINRPRILLLDEPTGNLDSHTGEQIFDLIRDINARERQTIVMVTHNESAARRLGRVVVMKDGEIITR